MYDNNYTIDIACSKAKEFSNQNYEDKIKKLIPKACNYFNISSSRSVFKFSNIIAYKELKRVIKNGDYDLVWTNEPVMGMLTRLASIPFRSAGLKVLYLVHGLHFFKGGPIKNWFFFPFEFIISYFTDLIVVINKADLKLISSFFLSPVKYLAGIGFDHSKFSLSLSINSYVTLRRKLNIKKDDIIVLAVGELHHHKNHITAIKALSKIKKDNVKLLICGVGPLLNHLKLISSQLNISNRVNFLGLRNDIPSILKISDIFIHPSTREGLGMAPLEAMASGLPIITSNVGGMVDYSVDGITGYICNPKDVGGFATALNKLINNNDLRKKFGSNGKKLSKKFDISNSLSQFYDIVRDINN